MNKNKTKLIPFLIAIYLEDCFLLPEPVCPIEDDIYVAVQLCIDLLSPLSAVQIGDIYNWVKITKVKISSLTPPTVV